MKKLHLSILSVAVLAAFSPLAFAQAQPTQTDADIEGLHVRANAGIEHDSNVLRVPSGAGPQSDTAAVLGVGLSFNKLYSLQRVRADLEFDRYNYQHHSNLSYNTINYALAWDWSFTPRLHGVVSADRRQYRDVQTDPLTGVNLVGRRTERAEVAEGVFEVAGPWRVLAGVQHTSADSTQPVSWDGRPSINEVHVGAGYEFPSGSSATLRYRRGDGEYRDPQFLTAARDFKDNEVDLAVKWALTGKTNVEASIGRLKREHSNASQLDFSGTVGKATVAYDITGKTRVVAGYLRDISGSGLSTGGSVTNDRFYIAPVWNATAKTSFNLRYDHTKRDWNGVPAGTPNAGRSETIQSFGVGADWAALRTITFSAYARNERQRSSLGAGAGYHANVYGVLAKARF